VPEKSSSASLDNLMGSLCTCTVGCCVCQRKWTALLFGAEQELSRIVCFMAH
jgi:hypothetical protein